MFLQCCICNNDKHVELFRILDGYEYVRCESCGLVFLRIDKSYCNKFYEDSSLKRENKKKVSKHAIEYWSIPNLYEKYQDIFHNFFYERISRLRKFGYHNGPLLDIGCGYGFFIKYCENKGIKSFGIDTEEVQIEWAKKKWGLNVFTTSVENFNPSYVFEAVVMADVLEHIWDPEAVLLKVKNFLINNGFLAIQVPNLLGFKLPPGHGWGVPHHIWQFNQKTLLKLIDKTGYKFLCSFTGVLGMIGMYENGGPSLKEKFYIWMAAKFHIGNRLFIICQKK